MNKADARFSENSASDRIRLQLVDWVEEGPLAVTIRHALPRPVPPAEVDASKCGKLNFSIFNHPAAGGGARFRRRRWQSCFAC